MARAYTDRLYTKHSLGSDTLIIPVTERWVVRTITEFWAAGVPLGEFQIVSHATLATIFYDNSTPPALGQYNHFDELRLVLLESEQYDLSSTGSPDITLNGYKLTLP